MTRIESSQYQSSTQFSGQHTVRKGDTLSQLAAENGISLHSLQEVNPNLDPRRLKIGQTIVLPTSAKQLSIVPYTESRNHFDDFARAYRTTQAIESGSNKFAAYQNYDKGIVSYGCIQFTLKSGSLQEVVERFVAKSRTAAAKTLASYLPWPADLESLRHDKRFKKALVAAASESSMQTAQLEVLRQRFWKPAAARAEQIGLSSTLAKSILFDTNVQGGMNTIITRTNRRLFGLEVSEQRYLELFLEERTKYLTAVAPQTVGRLDVFRSAVSEGNLALD